VGARVPSRRGAGFHRAEKSRSRRIAAQVRERLPGPGPCRGLERRTLYVRKRPWAESVFGPISSYEQ
jgi:hypothetical protein